MIRLVHPDVISSAAPAAALSAAPAIAVPSPLVGEGQGGGCSAGVIPFPAGRTPLPRPAPGGEPVVLLMRPGQRRAVPAARPFDEVAVFKRMLAERAFRAVATLLRTSPTPKHRSRTMAKPKPKTEKFRPSKRARKSRQMPERRPGDAITRIVLDHVTAANRKKLADIAAHVNGAPAVVADTPLDQPEVPFGVTTGGGRILHVGPARVDEGFGPSLTITADDALAVEVAEFYARRLQEETGDTLEVKRIKALAHQMTAHQIIYGATLPGAPIRR